MSVATQHSPFAVGSKRLFESEENEDRLQRRDSGAATHKRYRRLGSPNDRCGSGGCQGAYLVSPATLAALRGLFPEMSDKVRGAGRAEQCCGSSVLPQGCCDWAAATRNAVPFCLFDAGPAAMLREPQRGQSLTAPAPACPPCLQVIADVLAEYGDNIDAAIKHLTDLRLATPSTSAVATAEQQAAAAAAAAEQHAAAAEQRRQQEQAAAAQQERQQQPQQGAADAAAGQLRSAEEWIDIVVQEMAAAKDITDARARASKVLQAFEQAAVQHAKQV